MWVDEATGRITRYNLAYINHKLYAGDNGSVVGYDNAHDGHHRHYFGVVEPIEFVSFEMRQVSATPASNTSAQTQKQTGAG